MKRLNLDNHSPFHKTGHTSKGDQRKWKIGDRWYKADYMGYESFHYKQLQDYSYDDPHSEKKRLFPALP